MELLPILIIALIASLAFAVWSSREKEDVAERQVEEGEQPAPYKTEPKQSPCFICGGDGKIFTGELSAPIGDAYMCPNCNGKGWVTV